MANMSRLIVAQSRPLPFAQRSAVPTSTHRLVVSFIALVVSFVLQSHAVAAPITFYGLDPAAGPGGPRPNSDAAGAAFMAALVPSSIAVEDFEGEPIGLFATLGVQFQPTSTAGVVTALAAFWTQIDNVNSVPPGLFAISGSRFLTSGTSGDSNFFELTLSAPQYAIGFYGTDFSDYLGSAPGTAPPIGISLDGSSLINTLVVDPAFVPTDSVNFFGIITDAPFTTVRWVNPLGTGNDGIAVDDVTIGAPVPVPEPGTLSLTGFGALGWLARRRRGPPSGSS